MGTQQDVEIGYNMRKQDPVHNDKIPPQKQKGVTNCKLFPYCTKLDTFLLALGTITAVLTGCLAPFRFFLTGNILSLYLSAAISNNGTSVNDTNPFDAVLDQVLPDVVMFFIIAGAIFVTSTLSFGSFACVAERQIHQIRIQFFHSVMRQDIAWFETHKSGELNNKFSGDILHIYEGNGEKLSNCIQQVVTWLASMVWSLVLGWKLALICISFSPVLIVVAAIWSRFLQRLLIEESKKYAKAGTVASEALTAIRTVQAFQGQEKECRRYDANLNAVKAMGGKKGFAFGLSVGVFWGMYFTAFAVSLWYIIYLTQTENLDPGILYPIIIMVLSGSAALGLALPYTEILSKSLTSATEVLDIIGTVPVIDSSSNQGHKLQKVLGNIHFRNVCFSYPSRPGVKVLKNLNLCVPQGKVLAVVGQSGSGKSTIVQLLQRFYDPVDGQILLDEHDIRELNINWLRHQFGVVSQEPVLFDTTISENIRYGNMDIDQNVIEKAAREANAHDFILQLPLGYETVIGDRGAWLSGGQKQRIAIARALVRDPKILLLDEATSALDHTSEALVQSALEQVEKGRTVIVVAHRLSTVQNADIIVTLSQGEVVEQGTHDELLREKGLYFRLVIHQMQANEALDEEEWEDIQLQDKTLEQENGNLAIKPAEEKYYHESLEMPSGFKKDGVKNKINLTRLMRINSSQWPYLLFGFFATSLLGPLLPGSAIITTEFIKIFGNQHNPEKQSREIPILCGMLVAIGAVLALAKLLQKYCFYKYGAALTARIRSMTFKAIVNQDMSFFDETEHQVGNLITRLASDGQQIQSVATEIATLVEVISVLLCVVVISLIYSWRLGLVLSVFVPLLVLSGQLTRRSLLKASDHGKITAAGKIFSEATENIRTVAPLCRQETFLKRYENIITEIYKSGLKQSASQAIANGFAVCVIHLTFGVCFGYGSYLVQNREIEYFVVMRVLLAVAWGGQYSGHTGFLQGEYEKGMKAAGRMFSLIDKPKCINTTSPGKILENYSGALNMTNVSYRYKSRSNVTVLNGVSLGVLPGQTVALVGASGSGKTTIIQLIERFYDVENGAVMADKTCLQSLDVKWWRSQLALVSQEPILFDCSIADNIAYGDNSRDVPLEDIIAAARMANIHTFIQALPLGYETNVGSQGTQLSGGQKQRVAIARALIRNPKVLLLDEATSSLDSENEKIIQDTLEKAREGRTCIAIAHRLSTVQNADKIAVLKQGKIIEVGSHSELLDLKGAYFTQIQAQAKR